MTVAYDPDTIRILISTDNHVGYEERHPIRGDDSWKSFDEVMTLAKTQDVDMVLLAGDLFHDNKPSRKSLYQVMKSLRKNCLGDKPCELEFLSEAKEVLAGGFETVNYEMEDINVGIPVFSIHGNHDDPAGEGHLCSLDLLQVAGLVNYFGKIDEADNIHAKPVLLSKGSTKLSLYGLSNVRDERMFRTFRDGRVKWYKPAGDKSEWFNLLSVHQNHHAHTATSYLPEGFLPDWMDVVVWGHEHECLIDPRQNPDTGFHVMQPGSSVATSLCPGEAVAKHVAILSVKGKAFKVDKIPLRTVRPFVIREITLASDKRFCGLDRPEKNQDARIEITKRLMDIVEEMIEEANESWRESHPGEDEGGMPLPLIRLKVEYSAAGDGGGSYDVENPQRFSNRFVGRVANTNDVVLFHRRKAVTKAPKTAKANLPEGLPTVVDDDDDEAPIQVSALVQEFLAAQSLKILPQAPFGDAVNQFVAKDDKHAMEHFVSESLAGQVQQMLALDSDDDDLDTAMESYRERLDEEFQRGAWSLKGKGRRYREKPEGWDSDMEGHWMDQEEAIADDNEDEESPLKVEPLAKSRAAAKGKGKAKTFAKKPAASTACRTRKAPTPDDLSDDIIMDSDDYAPPPPKRTATTQTRASAAKEGAATTAASTSASSRASAGKKQSTLDFSFSQRGTLATRMIGRTASRARKEVVEINGDDVEDDVEDDDSDEFESVRRR